MHRFSNPYRCEVGNPEVREVSKTLKRISATCVDFVGANPRLGARAQARPLFHRAGPLTRYCHSMEAGDEHYCFCYSINQAKGRVKTLEQAMKVAARQGSQVSNTVDQGDSLGGSRTPQIYSKKEDQLRQAAYRYSQLPFAKVDVAPGKDWSGSNWQRAAGDISASISLQKLL